ncbi:GNAT family N-acetyltransferase [Alsobacter sp. SYSU M60028]|uniref:GNAT family N-acetyltransferase n=1 Tax=Alsobacter ponti TaxID=2962936 RepID=A0ABT1L8A5_9HYPH|nr:GNAT family N-acetyltransferase [Alsobacter ponti]MCP8937148.1 GNAT family N-acetyltransferase [Alsobacter ponti]
MATIIRPARESDLEVADALVVASINDLTQRHGFGTIASPSPPLFQRFSLRDDPEGLWVAEDGGEIVGFAFSWTTEDFWFLAQLFVSPDRQADGLGGRMIAKTLEHAGARGARYRTLITFAFNRASQGLYMRHGLRPLTPLYVMSGPREVVAGRLKESGIVAEPLDPDDASSDWLRAIDEASLGVSRARHHAYMLGAGGLQGFAFRAGGERFGHAYVGADGHVGPIAAREAGQLPEALTAALALACRTPRERVSAFLPGSSPAALTAALDAGLRIALPMLLMGDALPRPWDRYCPRNPGIM